MLKFIKKFIKKRKFEDNTNKNYKGKTYNLGFKDKDGNMKYKKVNLPSKFQELSFRKCENIFNSKSDIIIFAEFCNLEPQDVLRITQDFLPTKLEIDYEIGKIIPNGVEGDDIFTQIKNKKILIPNNFTFRGVEYKIPKLGVDINVETFEFLREYLGKNGFSFDNVENISKQSFDLFSKFFLIGLYKESYDEFDMIQITEELKDEVSYGTVLSFSFFLLNSYLKLTKPILKSLQKETKILNIISRVFRK